MLDDAYIFLTYADNLLKTGNWSFNGLTSANGVTSPLYTLLLALGGFITHLDIAKVSSLLNAGIWLLWGLITFLLVKEFIRSPLLAFMAALIITTLPYFPTVYRMETHLLLVLICCSLIFYIRKHYFLMGVAGGLAILVRPDAAIILCILLGFLLKKDYKALPKAFLPSIIIVLSWSICSWFLIGKFVPDTLSIKIGQGASGFWPTSFFHGLLDQIHDIYVHMPVSVLLFLLSSILLVARFCRIYYQKVLKKNAVAIDDGDTDKEEAGIILLLYLLIYTIFYGIIFKMPNYHWYYAPIIYFGAIILLAQLNWINIASYSGKAIVVLILMMLSLCQQWQANPPLMLQPLTSAQADYKVIGEFIRANTLPGATLGATEVGILSWYAKRPVIDCLGLDDRLTAEKVSAREVGWWLRHRAPDYLLFNNPAWVWQKATPYQDWATVPWFQQAYRPCHEFSLIRGNYILYQKVMPPDQAIEKTRAAPPMVAFCLERYDDRDVLGVDDAWAIKIQNSRGEPLSVQKVLNARSLSDPQGSYKCITEDPIIELADVTNPADESDKKWFLKISLTGWSNKSSISPMGRDSEGQLFMATKAQPEYNSKQVISFRVILDAAAHTYYVPLFADGGWLRLDQITGLRLDPLSVRGRFRINSVELCSF